MILNLRRFRQVLISGLRLLRIAQLKMYGVEIDWSASVDWSASIEPSGGKIYIGRDSLIDRGALLRAYGGAIRIGSRCRINPYAVLYGDGGLTIGDGVRVAAHAVIVPANHVFSDSERFIFEQGQSCLGIVIEDDVWIGAGVCVLDGVTIAKGTVVGAGAVITKSTIAFDIVVGVPAKKIGSRKQ